MLLYRYADGDAVLYVNRTEDNAGTKEKAEASKD